jgi:hypothetical protein
VEPDGVDAVVVGHEDAHPAFLARRAAVATRWPRGWRRWRPS